MIHRRIEENLLRRTPVNSDKAVIESLNLIYNCIASTKKYVEARILTGYDK